MWCNNQRLYDLIVCYYGDQGDDDEHVHRLKNCCDSFYKRKGGKFPNFLFLWNNDKISKQYSHYFIVDDDIRITSAEIDKLFQIAEKSGLRICQPAFDGGAPGGTISHVVTTGNLENKGKYRLTNFVEVTAMLFSRDTLTECMRHYDGSLVGWGIDWLCLNVIGSHKANEKTAKANGVAVVDDILCINPFERHCQKTGEPVGKEITRLEVESTRAAKWIAFRDNNQMVEFSHTSFYTEPIDVRLCKFFFYHFVFSNILFSQVPSVVKSVSQSVKKRATVVFLVVRTQEMNGLWKK